MAARLPTGTVTFLIADIEGSTRHVQEMGAQYAAILATVRRILRTAVDANDGVEVDATGDELCAVFADAPAAIGSALEAQRILQQELWPGEAQVRVRIGLHTGAPALGDEGYIGLDVIRAARVSGAGHGGQILLSSPPRSSRPVTSCAISAPINSQDFRHQSRSSSCWPTGSRATSPRFATPSGSSARGAGSWSQTTVFCCAKASFACSRRSGSRLSGNRVRRPTSSDTSRCTRLMSPSSISACRRRTPTRASGPRRDPSAIPGNRVLVLSQYVEAGYAFELLAGSAEGVGYLLKDRISDLNEFGAAVRRVADGGSALDPEVVSGLLGRKRRHDPLDEISPREREVLELMAEGRSNQAIADRMFVTLRAVEKHVTSIFTKLGLPASADDHRRVLAVLTYMQS